MSSSTGKLSTSHHRVLSTTGQGNSFVKQSRRCHQIRVTIQEQNHKYERRAGVVSPPEAAPLTFHPSRLCQPCRWHKCKLREAGVGKREKDKVCLSVRDMGRHGAGGGPGQSAPRGVATRLIPWRKLLKNLHVGSSLRRVEHSDNLFKEKQITPQVKGHGGTLVKTFYVSLHCSLSTPFEDRFHYNNILNQSLNSLSSRSSLFTVGWVEMT